MGEKDDNEEEDDDDKGNIAAPPTAPAPRPAPMPPTAATEVITINEEYPMEMVPEQEAHEAHEVVLADVEPELS
jgi:hypothetical protein